MQASNPAEKIIEECETTERNWSEFGEGITEIRIRIANNLEDQLKQVKLEVDLITDRIVRKQDTNEPMIEEAIETIRVLSRLRYIDLSIENFGWN